MSYSFKHTVPPSIYSSGILPKSRVEKARTSHIAGFFCSMTIGCNSKIAAQLHRAGHNSVAVSFLSPAHDTQTSPRPGGMMSFPFSRHLMSARYTIIIVNTRSSHCIPSALQVLTGTLTPRATLSSFYS